ncbi:cation-efflux pump, partial [Acinetobacter baumannii]|nr:cation-efflux pump [Acinetobacter baumannii]
LWSASGHLAQPQTIPPVHSAALWMALVALAVKEGLFRYMLAAARRLNSSLLIANAWHARSDAASSLVVALGIIGNLAGFAW